MAAADLWDHAAYVRTTGDYTSDPHELEGFWLDALAMVGDHLQRYLASDTYTHRLRVWPRGFVYPHAIPVTSVAASASYVLEDECTISNCWPDLQPLIQIGLGSGADPRLAMPGDFGRWLTYVHDHVWATVTYVGGYTKDTLPSGLRRTLNQITQALKSSAGSTWAQARGASSMAVGDVSVTLGPNVPSVGELDELIPGVTKALRRYRLPNYG